MYSFGASAVGQKPRHARADALLFGQVARQSADGEIENAETEGAENRHSFAYLPGRRVTEQDIRQCGSE